MNESELIDQLVNVPSQGAANSAASSPDNSSRTGDDPVMRALAAEGVDDPAVAERLYRLANVESSGGKNTLGPIVKTGMNAGDRARGAFQIMPKTFSEVMPGGDINDPDQANRAGVRYFMNNLSRFGGDLDAATVAHHAGPETAARWKAGEPLKTSDGNMTTADYLARIRGDNRPAAPDLSTWGRYDPSLDRTTQAGDRDSVARARQAHSDANPMTTSLKRGWNQMTDSVGNAIDLASGNTQGVVDRVQAAQERDELMPQPTANKQWMQDWQDSKTTNWLFNPAGFVGNNAEQLANSAPIMAGSIPGGIAGAAAGTAMLGPVGTVIGGMIGGFLGSAVPSAAVETGGRITEMAANDGVNPTDTKAFASWLNDNRSKILEQGSIKGMTTAAFDGLMSGVGSRIVAGPLLKFNRVEAQTLGKMGVDLTDKAAMDAARKTAAYKAAIQPAAAELKAATSAAGNAMRGFAEFAGEAGGEGLGEYYGEKFATGQGNFDEAMLEALMAGGTSMVSTAAQFAARPIIGQNAEHAEIKRLTDLANYTPKADSPLSNAAVAGQQAAVGVTPETTAAPESSDADAHPFNDAEMDRKHAEISAFLGDREKIAELRKQDPQTFDEAYHVWRNVINNPDMPIKTRIAALDQGYAMLMERPNFTMPNGESAGDESAPSAGGALVAAGRQSVGPVDPRAGSIDGQFTRMAGELGVTPQIEQQGDAQSASPQIKPEQPEQEENNGQPQLRMQDDQPAREQAATESIGDEAGESYVSAADDVRAEPVATAAEQPALSDGQAPVDGFDVSGRSDAQLSYLSSNGRPGWKEAAIAEMDRRGLAVDHDVATMPTAKSAASVEPATIGATAETPKVAAGREWIGESIAALETRRPAAQAIGKEKELDKGIALAKRYQAGEDIKPAQFVSIARSFKADQETAEAFKTLAARVKNAAPKAERIQRSKASTPEIQVGAVPPDDVPATAENPNTSPDRYNQWALEQEHDAIVRRLQDDAVVRQDNGKPFKSERSAESYKTKFDLTDTHAIRPVDGGFELRRLGEAQRPSVLKALAERRANDPETQRQEAAFARARDVGAAADDVVGRYQNGDIEIADFENELNRIEKPENNASPTTEFERGQAMLAEGLDELVSLLGGKMNMSPEEESHLIPIMSKIFRGAAIMGYVTFKDAARHVVNLLRTKAPDVAEKLSIDNLQAGYINVAKAIGGDKREALAFESIDELMADHDAVVEAKAEAEKKTDINPSDAQKAAENYRKGKFDWNGLTIAVENPKGSERSGKDESGQEWHVTMPATYGYILGTVGADKDHVDIFVGDNLLAPNAYVVNQNKPDSDVFDEHKVLVGFDTAEQAKQAYLDSFTDGFGENVFASINGPLSIDELKAALPELKKKKAFGVVDEAPKAEPVSSMAPDAAPASWVIKNKETGEIVMETFDRAKVDALNTEKYEAVPIIEHLASLNRAQNGVVEQTPAGLKPGRTEVVAERIVITKTGARVFGPNPDDLYDRARVHFGRGVTKRNDGISIAAKYAESVKGLFPLRDEFYTLAGLPERYAPIKVAVYEDGAQVEGINFGYVSGRAPSVAEAIAQYRESFAQDKNPDAPKPEKALAKPQQAPIMRRDDLVGAIMRVTGGKGIAAHMAQTVAGDTANKLARLRGLFVTDGVMDLDDVAMLLREEEGYDVKDGNHLAELIREQAAGNPVYSMARMEREKADAAEKQYRAEIREKAEEFGIKTMMRKFDDVEREVLARQVEDARQSEQEAAAEREAIAAADEVSDETINALLKKSAEEGRYIDEEWISNDALYDAFEPVGEGQEESLAAGIGEIDSGEAGEDHPGASEEARTGLALEGQTLEEVNQQEADRQAAIADERRQAEQEAAEKRANEKKSFDDAIKAHAANPDNFQFGESGKDAAKPMGDLFNQPVVQPKAEEKPEPKSWPFEADEKWYNAEGTERLPYNWQGVAQAKSGTYFLFGYELTDKAPWSERSFTALNAKTYADALIEAATKPSISNNVSRETEASWKRANADENVSGWGLYHQDPWLDYGLSRIALLHAPYMIDFVFPHGNERAKATAIEAAREWAGKNPARSFGGDPARIAAEVVEPSVAESVGDSDALTEAQALKQTAWQDLGQRDSVKSHRLMFNEDAAGDPLKGITIATVSKFDGSKWMVDGEPFNNLKDAKKAAQARGLDYLRREGYVAKPDESPAAPVVQDEKPRAVDPEMVATLNLLGYADDAIASMTPSERLDVTAEGKRRAAQVRFIEDGNADIWGERQVYYIDAGAETAMRTLRVRTRVQTMDGEQVNDQYVRNLARDKDEAVAKAKLYVGMKDAKFVAWGTADELNDYKKGGKSNPDLTPDTPKVVDDMSDTEVCAHFGLPVTQRTARSGKPYWSVPSIKEKANLLDALGFAKPFKMGKEWLRSSFDSDPTAKLADALRKGGSVEMVAEEKKALPKLDQDDADRILDKFCLSVINESSDPAIHGNWIVSGKKTYDLKDAIKKAGARWNGSAWAFDGKVFNDDPSATLAYYIADHVKEGSVGGNAENNAGTDIDPAEDEHYRAIREREDGRGDERLAGDAYFQLVTDETRRLIENGLKFGIPADVVRNQIEDVGMMKTAFQREKPVFILANEAGTGKTYVLGGAIRELRDLGHGKFVYVTMNQDLIAQIRRDLSAFGVDDVQFYTYSDFSGKKNIDTDGAVLIFDESHNIKNVGAGTARADRAQELIKQARMTVVASATPFENPVEARYMEATGLFNPAGNFVEWVKSYGASVKRRKFYNPNIGREQTEEIVYWAGRGKKKDGAAARNWFFKQGVMTQRPMKLDARMVDVAFKRYPVEQTWVDLYNTVESIYEAAQNEYRDENGSSRDYKITSEIARHRENTIKRVLESSKIPAAIERTRELLDAGRNVVIFVETKADRTLGLWRKSEFMKDDTLYSFAQMQELMAEWRHAAAVARREKDKAPPKPFADFIYEIARKFDEAGLVRELPSTAYEIVAAFGENDVAMYTGAITATKASKNKADFLAGKKRVLVATMAKGGTGLSLHDTVGNRPTTQLNINLPWKATGVDQVSARVARYGLKSKAEVEWLFAANIAWESTRLAPKVGARMRDMGAIVKGVEVKAAELLDGGFDFEGVVDVKQQLGEGIIDTSDDAEEGDDYARAERLEQSRRKADDTRNGFFGTPYPLAVLMSRVAGVKAGQIMLEPSAGHGNLIKFLPEGVQIHAVELRDDNRDVLKAMNGGDLFAPQSGNTLYAGDFLDVKGGELAGMSGAFDTVLMNPPFERMAGIGAQDVAHVQAAHELLRDGGRLVAIMGEGAFFRGSKQESEFRQWLDDVGATVVKLPAGTFAKSGTGVSTRMVVIDKGASAGRSDVSLDDTSVDSMKAIEAEIPSRASVEAIAESEPAPVEEVVTPQEAEQAVEQLADEPPAEPQMVVEDTPEQTEADDAANVEKVADFGEKIGGARKDTARQTGPRLERERDERPAWARKYVVMQDTKDGSWGVFVGQKNSGFVTRVCRQTFPTDEAALDFIPLAEVARKHRVYAYRDGKAEGGMKWAIYRQMGERKRTQVKGDFPSEEAATLYMVQHPIEIIEHKFPFPERPWLDNLQRIGKTHRTGNVTVERFAETFGFRGGEFGNWNMGGDGQEVLNHAYDALLDFADVLGVPPKAMSLNGELAIAFGSRGRGAAGFKEAGAAHYERDYAVINMTKIRGAGSLAHEWFHAFDHYLARVDGKSSSEKVQNERGDTVYKKSDDDFATGGFRVRGSKARPELVAAFEAVLKAISKKETTVEVDVIRAEKILEQRKTSLEYSLKSLRDYIARERSWGRKKAPANAEQLAAWDTLADRLRAGDAGEKVKVMPGSNAGRFSLGRGGSSVIAEMNTIYKSVTGRSFDKSDYENDGYRLLQNVESMKRAEDTVKYAKESPTEIRSINTQFVDDAKDIDAGRVSPYYTRPEELGARAFEAFILDKLTERAGRNDYLVYGADNKYYRLFGQRPYPEGEERVAIDAAFDKLFKAIKTEPTDKGVSVFRSRAADVADVSGRIDAPTADALASRLLVDIGAPTTDHVVVESFYDLPEEVQSDARAQDSDEKTTKGVLHRGTMYIVAGNLQSISDLERTVFHEMIGHLGMRKLLGSEFVQKMNALFGQLGGLIGLSKIAAENGFGPIFADYVRGIAKARSENPQRFTESISKFVLTEEVFAHLAEQKPTIYQKAKALIGWVRDWLRRHGFAQLAEYGETDILHLLNQARNGLQGPGGNGPKGGVTPAVLQRIVEAKATPTEAIDNEIPVVMKRGPVEETIDAVTTPEGRKKITDYLAYLFGKDSKKTFNLLHKTIGTQFHKAKIDVHFRKVYEGAQSFLEDVARFGAESADKAPHLLPKMDTVGDAVREAWNYKADQRDVEAIAKPIFEGTLYEGKDEDGNTITGKVWTDTELRDRFDLDDKQIALYREFRSVVDHSLESLAMSEMNKAAKANGLEAPSSTMSMRDLSDFYAAQFGNQMRALEERLALLKKQAQTDGKALMENAAKLGYGREAYHEVMRKHEEEQALVQKKIMDELEGLKALWDGIVGKKNTILKLEREGYAPLMRFGNFTVDVVEDVPAVDDDGKFVFNKKTGEQKMDEVRHFFGMFETEREAIEAEKAFKEEYPEATVTRGVASDDGYQLYGGINADSLEMIAKLAGREDEIVQKFYKEAVSSRSALKRLIHRQGIAGYSKDVTRTLASFILSNARAASSAKHFGDLIEAAAEIPKEKGDVKDEAVRLINYIRDPNEEAGALRGILFMQFLGGSVASAAVNLSQTVVTTFPFLHQFGGGAKDIASAANMARKRMGSAKSTGDVELDAVLKRAEEEGVVSPHNIHAIMGETGTQGLTRHRAVRLMSHLWGSMFGMAEQFNRETTFIAAYRLAERLGGQGLQDAFNEQAALAQKRGLPAPDAAIYASAFNFAKNAVNETQFVLSKAARPNWSRGAVGATLMTFKQFAVFYLELLKRLPAKERAIALAVLMVLAGAGGLPGSDDLDDLIDTLGQAVGYDTNAKGWKERTMAHVFGREGSNFILNGVSAFLPIDLQSRLGMDNLIPSSGIFKKSASGNRDREFSELFGAAGGYYKQLSDAADYLLAGRYGMAVTQGFAPKAIKDVSKGIDMATNGTYDDAKGRRVTDVSMSDAFWKSIGFQPTKVSNIQEQKGIGMQDNALVRVVRDSISEVWAQGIHERDAAKTARAREMLAEWNEKNPDSRIQINLGNVQRRARQMSLSAQERFMNATPKTMRKETREAFDNAIGW